MILPLFHVLVGIQKISMNGRCIVGVTSGNSIGSNGSNSVSNNNLSSISSKDEVWFRVNIKPENSYGDAWQKMEGNMKQVVQAQSRWLSL